VRVGGMMLFTNHVTRFVLVYCPPLKEISTQRILFLSHCFYPPISFSLLHCLLLWSVVLFHESVPLWGDHWNVQRMAFIAGKFLPQTLRPHLQLNLSYLHFGCWVLDAVVTIFAYLNTITTFNKQQTMRH